MHVDNACALIALSILCWLVQTGCSATTSDDFLVDEAGLLHPAEANIIATCIMPCWRILTSIFC